MDLVKIFGSRMQTKLIQYLLQNSTKVFNQAGLARFLGCSPSTVARLIDLLAKEEIVVMEQLSGQMKVIALNMESPKVRVLIEFFDKLQNA